MTDLFQVGDATAYTSPPSVDLSYDDGARSVHVSIPIEADGGALAEATLASFHRAIDQLKPAYVGDETP